MAACSNLCIFSPPIAFITQDWNKALDKYDRKVRMRVMASNESGWMQRQIGGPRD